MRILHIRNGGTAALPPVGPLLAARDMTVDTADHTDGVTRAETGHYDLILVDLAHADTHGRALLSEIRAALIRTPIIALSCARDTEELVDALRQGADDYLAAPFPEDELVARIEAIVRRERQLICPTITIGGLSLGLSERKAYKDGHHLHLTPSEYLVIELLFKRRGQVIPKEDFLRGLYDDRYWPEPRIVAVLICRVRKWLWDNEVHGFRIDTVRGEGYVLRTE